MINLSPILTGIVLYVAFNGWGKATCKLLEIFFKEKLPTYLHSVMGMSIVLAIGGYLNLFQLINTTTITCSIIVGMVVYFLCTKFRFEQIRSLMDPRFKTRNFSVELVAYLGTFYIFAISCLNQIYNPHDDFEGYFSFASKIQQQGTLGNDPFSERRMVSSLGGQSFLDALTLQFQTFDFLHVTDLGVGLLIFLSSVYHYLKQKKWNSTSIACSIFILALVNPLNVNISASYTLISITFILTTLIFDHSSLRRSNLNPYLFAFIAAAGLTLKNTAIPFTVMLLCLYCGISNGNNPKPGQYINRLIKCLMTWAIVIWPWCVSLYLSNGTFLYPLLGKGFHGSQYGTFNFDSNFLSKDFLYTIIESSLGSLLLTPTLFLSLVIFTACFILQEATKLRITILTLGFIAVISGIIIAIGTGGYDPFRYNLPFLLGVTVGVFTHLRFTSFVRIISITSFSIALPLIWMLMQNSVSYEILKKLDPRVVLHSNSDPNLKKIPDIQNKLPIGAKALLRTRYNYLFNLKRNELYIVDYPGGSSLPPGIPLFSTPDKLEYYLVDLGIDYVIFQYSELFDRKDFGARLDADYSPWLKVEAENAFAFQDRVMELAMINQVPYKDELFVVVKLTS